jgi:hypothetical protein
LYDIDEIVQGSTMRVIDTEDPTMYTRTATQSGLDHPTLVIRRAAADDASALAQLAALDSSSPLRGEVLVAYVDDEPWAAVSLADGRAVADPFRPSALAVELLRIRARHLRAAPAAGRVARSLRGLRRAEA